MRPRELGSPVVFCSLLLCWLALPASLAAGVWLGPSTAAAGAEAAHGPAAAPAAEAGEPDAATMAVRLAQEMAQSASRRDVKALAKLIPQEDRVVYVSNGHPITGRRYVETLGAYYDSLQSLDFKWDRWEVAPIDRDAAVFTGWAVVKTVDRKGVTESGRALFTMVFARGPQGWKRVIAQKWQADVPSLTATWPAGGATAVPPASPITLHFSGPVDAGATAFRLECPSGRQVAVAAAPLGAADATTWVLKPRADLPAGAACTVTVSASQVTDDRFGQALAGDASFSFSVATGR